jgi:hypothetical protein
MAQLIEPDGPVMRKLKSGKWPPFTNYARYGDAEIAACG